VVFAGHDRSAETTSATLETFEQSLQARLTPLGAMDSRTDLHPTNQLMGKRDGTMLGIAGDFSWHIMAYSGYD